MIDDSNKFNEVVSDIIHLIGCISYEDDLEKEKLRTQILMNFNRMHQDYPSYLSMISVLKEEENDAEKNEPMKVYTKK